MLSLSTLLNPSVRIIRPLRVDIAVYVSGVYRKESNIYVLLYLYGYTRGNYFETDTTAVTPGSTHCSGRAADSIQVPTRRDHCRSPSRIFVRTQTLLEFSGGGG